MNDTQIDRAGNARIPTRAHWRVRTRVGLAATVLIGAGVFTAPSVAGGATPSWTDAGLHVVGGPVVADNMILVNDVNTHRQLEVSGINPTTGTVVWSAPFAQSAITAGVGFPPTSVGSMVLDFAPDGTEANALVYVEGLDAATGTPIWHFTTPIQVADAPLVCGLGRYFCLTYFSSQNGTSLLELDPRSGQPVAQVKGPERAMGTAIAGHSNTSILWQDTATAPTFEQISPDGIVQWIRSVSSLFGGSEYDPNYGWNFNVVGALDVGMVGVRTQGAAGHLSEDLGALKTIGINTANGNRRWSAKGAYQCGGSLNFLTSVVACVYKGVAKEVGGSLSTKGISLTLRGLNSVSGAPSWSEPVLNVQSLSVGTRLSFVDSTHVLVENVAKKWVVLDTNNGSTIPAASNATYWCEVTSPFTIIAVTGVTNSSSRVAMPVFRGCNAEGNATNAVPSTTPANVGVNISGMFVWASPQGLNAVAMR